MKLLISAAEASADLHASKLVEALRRLIPDLLVKGIGGKHLRDQGAHLFGHASQLAVMGSFEVLSKLPAIRKAEKAMLLEAERFRPDVAIVVDYPGFHFRVGPRLNALGIPVVYFIPPKVWVWRRNRIHSMRKWVSRVLCVLPFEPPIYQQAGIPAEFVGSPLIEELPIDLSRQQARDKLGLSEHENVLVLMPGSRTSEMQRHWTPFLEAADQFAGSTQRSWTVLIPIASTLEFSFWESSLGRWSKEKSQKNSKRGDIRIRLIREDSGLVLRSADLGLIKSGTSTLEAAVLECPMVIAYQPGWFTSFAVKHFLKYRGPVGLVNLFQGIQDRGRLLVPEILHEEMTAMRLAQELVSLYQSPERLEQMRSDLLDLRTQMLSGASEGKSPSDRAAKAILALVQGRCSEPGDRL